MATPVQMVWGEEYILELGNGATPTEVFARVALVNTNSDFTGTASTETAEVVDLDDLTLPATVVRRVNSVDTKIEAAGMVHAPAVQAMWDWFFSGKAKNMKFRLARTAANGGIVHAGSYVLTSFKTGGQHKSASECSMTFEQASAPKITAAA